MIGVYMPTQEELDWAAKHKKFMERRKKNEL
jgi:hypothetical protein